jgi:hypothetical protein
MLVLLVLEILAKNQVALRVFAEIIVKEKVSSAITVTILDVKIAKRTWVMNVVESWIRQRHVLKNVGME